ncbi:MAG TPA: hypothetical protein VF698_03545 [Thermoanaerobaculia bacterium]|jgi:hypothetical protein
MPLEVAVDWWKGLVLWISELSVIAIVIGVWLLYLFGSGALRFIRDRSETSRFGRVGAAVLSRLSGAGSVLTRAVNVISAVFLFLFLSTLRPKWLLGVIPLWSIPLATVFATAFFLFTPIWKAVGSQSRRWPYRLWNSD